MAAPGHQQHGLAGLDCGPGHLGHAGVAGQLDAGHGRQLGVGQQAAVAFADGVELALPALGRQVGVQVLVAHGLLHVGARQVAPQHGYARAHGGHDHTAVARPGPGRVLPLQGLLHCVLGGIARQAGRGARARRHLDHQRGQALLFCQLLHRGLLPGLVGDRVVLLAQQHDGRVGPALQLLRPVPRRGGGAGAAGKGCRQQCGRSQAGQARGADEGAGDGADWHGPMLNTGLARGLHRPCGHWGQPQVPAIAAMDGA